MLIAGYRQNWSKGISSSYHFLLGGLGDEGGMKSEVRSQKWEIRETRGQGDKGDKGTRRQGSLLTRYSLLKKSRSLQDARCTSATPSLKVPKP